MAATAPFTLAAIQRTATLAYIKALQSVLPITLKGLIAHAHSIAPELKAFCDSNQSTFKARDKGSAGKLVEFYIFGRKPNNDSTPDLEQGDIKCTHIKKTRDGYNAKERLTLTNVGATSDYANLQHILDNDLESNPRWEKVRQGILVVLERTEGTWTPEEATLNEQVTFFFHYDITMNPEWMAIMKADYEKIRECVAAKAASQKGQDFLHIHPHGSKNSTTRAFGFTNKFVTRLICHYGQLTPLIKGRSLYFCKA